MEKGCTLTLTNCTNFIINDSRVVITSHILENVSRNKDKGVVPELIQEEPSKNEIVRTRDRPWKKVSPAR